MSKDSSSFSLQPTLYGEFTQNVQNELFKYFKGCCKVVLLWKIAVGQPTKLCLLWQSLPQEKQDVLWYRFKMDYKFLFSVLRLDTQWLIAF